MSHRPPLSQPSRRAVRPFLPKHHPPCFCSARLLPILRMPAIADGLNAKQGVVNALLPLLPGLSAPRREWMLVAASAVSTLVQYLSAWAAHGALGRTKRLAPWRHPKQHNTWCVGRRARHTSKTCRLPSSTKQPREFMCSRRTASGGIAPPCCWALREETVQCQILARASCGRFRCKDAQHPLATL